MKEEFKVEAFNNSVHPGVNERLDQEVKRGWRPIQFQVGPFEEDGSVTYHFLLVRS